MNFGLNEDATLIEFIFNNLIVVLLCSTEILSPCLSIVILLMRGFSLRHMIDVLICHLFIMGNAKLPSFT